MVAIAASVCMLPLITCAQDEESESGVPNMTRTWSSKGSDSTVEATAIKLTDKAVNLRRIDNRKVVIVPLDKLGDEDLAWLEENKDFIGKSDKELKSMALTKIGKDLKGKTKGLVDGKWTKKEAKRTAKYFIVYFSASWCPPCRAGAPHSVESYNSKVANLPGLEIVMCNWDNTEDAAKAWAEKENMPWPMLVKTNIKAFEKVGPNGIPNLKLLDGDGNMIEEGGIDKLIETAKSKLKASDK